ncbi:MAG: hypothetical protein MZU79_02470 [Anaerotruncus sp.]|nr:hypothetical protein [Anaerotruncus sp.]
MKYGVQFGIGRMSIQSVHAPDPDFARRGEERPCQSPRPGRPCTFRPTSSGRP